LSFEPYVDNGGSAVAVAGTGFAIIAADRRLSKDYNILSRQVSKLVKLTDKAVLASCGMQADRNTLHSILKSRMYDYKINHEKEMSTHALSQMLSRTLYYRRFFPYYTFNILAGIDENGEGQVYVYDAIGSFEGKNHGATGSGVELGTPMLDSMVEKAHQSKPEKKEKLTKEKGIELVKDVLNSITERDIKTGDGADIYIITPEGIEHQFMPLRED